MVNRKQLDSIYEQYGYITIEVLIDRLDLSPSQALKLLLHVAKLGWYLPVFEAFFAPPNEDGTPKQWRAAATKVREAKTDKVLSFIKTSGAVTVRDIMAGLGIGDTPTRNALKELKDSSRVYFREAVGGGMFKNHPVIYGVDEGAVRKREIRLMDDVAAKKKAPRSKKKKPTVTKPEDPVLLAEQRKFEAAWEKGIAGNRKKFREWLDRNAEKAGIFMDDDQWQVAVDLGLIDRDDDRFNG